MGRFMSADKLEADPCSILPQLNLKMWQQGNWKCDSSRCRNAHSNLTELHEVSNCGSGGALAQIKHAAFSCGSQPEGQSSCCCVLIPIVPTLPGPNLAGGAVQAGIVPLMTHPENSNYRSVVRTTLPHDVQLNQMWKCQRHGQFYSEPCKAWPSCLDGSAWILDPVRVGTAAHYRQYCCAICILTRVYFLLKCLTIQQVEPKH